MAGWLQSGSDQAELQPDEHELWMLRKLLWNPQPLGSSFGRVSPEAFDRNPDDFGRTVMSLLEGAKEWLRLWNLGLALC